MRGLFYSGISGEQQTRHWEKFESSKRFAFYSIHPCLMNRITQRYNFKLAMLDVMRNKGSAGVDRVNVNDLPKILTLHHHEIRRSMLDGTYKPDPVLRVVIPKGDGRCRLLGIPTALDRVIQKAIQDRLDDAWDHTFSPFSYGFRRMRSSRHAIMKAREYIKSGLTWIIDIDLENFFEQRTRLHSGESI